MVLSNVTVDMFSPTGCEMKAHERDILMPKPQILKVITSF